MNFSLKTYKFTIANLIDKVNGVSNKCTVQQLFDIQLESNEIFLTYNNRRALPKNVKYNIYSTNFNNVSILKKGVIESENSTIDISEINSGNYILRIYADGIQQNLKFSK